MNRRFQTILDLENISPAQLADRLGVQRSGISHILSGRNEPSFKLLQKIIQTFPEINSDWLLTGSGKPLKEQSGLPSPESNNSSTQVSAPSNRQERANIQQYETDSNGDVEINDMDLFAQNINNQEDNSIFNSFQPSQNSEFAENLGNGAEKRALKRVILIYDDNSFEEFAPSKSKKR